MLSAFESFHCTKRCSTTKETKIKHLKTGVAIVKVLTGPGNEAKKRHKLARYQP